jgi:hypothetical protein
MAPEGMPSLEFIPLHNLLRFKQATEMEQLISLTNQIGSRANESLVIEGKNGQEVSPMICKAQNTFLN